MTSLRTHFQYPDVVLTRATESDIDSLVAVINHAYSYQDAAKGEPRINADKLRKRMGETEFYAARHQNQIVGCVYLEPKGAAMHFGLLTVIDSRKGSGLAPAIMAAIEADTRARGMASIQLDYMSLAPWLNAYYERYGFRETGQTVQWGAITLIQMEKPLI